MPSVPVPDEDREKAIETVYEIVALSNWGQVVEAIDALIELGWAPRPAQSGDHAALIAEARATKWTVLNGEEQPLEIRLAEALESKEAEFVDRRIVEAQALMDARHLVIGTPGFDALTARAAELRKAGR